ncbi:CRISPR system precrRNA processing endoribonuclease RAMP protein Cas6 [Ignicoccus hospitalis]|uniref:CRISPR-associated protein Cas6 C-terminal domain-containing protein n=1 Tax=Ignicoccus hospitalis (strain KIN4/I / DSM 18386 / JCM 14125) TaxID=453591 RepID=A8AA66_IGNH4|nr:CRISPR system precrRNA processing endoribonuclease RAMP protein Cas6 [Ignicoccus hospitalis]ABU81818.1 hypothetical protein Igni_0636 [Ignicoccus hospitalis KIN4/I]HIH90087.1 CRISPR system precrRNA processing endoribonuclease RAMP protein Cas6 [Desulfurococcaceae archaeon]
MITSVDVVLQITELKKIRVWKGVFAAKVVFDAFKSVDVDPDFPFHVVPPEKLSTEVKPGTEVSFKVNFWGEVASAPAKLAEGLLNVEYVLPIKVDVKTVEVESPPKGGDEPVAVFFRVTHGPTLYRFHGAWVPLPSAPRAVYSLFKRMSEVTGTDLKGYADSISSKVEVVGGRPRFSTFKIHKGDELPAFFGRVSYYGIMEEDLALKLLWALKYSHYFGLGSNVSLGFGDVKEVKVEKPPFEVPVKKYLTSSTSSES